jgi:threonine 3-dehydrogenase
MRALRKPTAGPGAELTEVPLPKVGPADVLLKVAATSICGTDLHIYQWDPWAAGRVQPPLTFGHEVAGYVVAAGSEVHHLPLGTFVAAETHLACGHCVACTTGRAHICEKLRILGVDTDGVFAEYVAIPAANAWITDEAIPLEVAALQESFGNAVHATLGTDGGSDLVAGTVVVLGCGPIGLYAIGIARAAGARQVIAVEPNAYRRDLAEVMGAQLVLDPTRQDPVQGVLGATGGRGAEVVLEMSGNARAIEQGTRMLARGGRMSLLGLPSGPVSLELADQVIFKEARLVGVTGREMFRTWQQTTALLSSGQVDVTPLITHRFPLERYADAFATVASGQSGKVIMVP